MDLVRNKLNHLAYKTLAIAIHQQNRLQLNLLNHGFS